VAHAFAFTRTFRLIQGYEDKYTIPFIRACVGFDPYPSISHGACQEHGIHGLNTLLQLSDDNRANK